MRCIHVGLLCVQEEVVERPSMTTIALMLSSYSLTLPQPLEPASFIGGRTRSLPYMSSGEDEGVTRSIQSKSKSVTKNSSAELDP